jgi:hypothetical protein
MPTLESLEQRVAILEATVARLQERLAGLAPPANWLERFRGAFQGDPAFEEIVELGRQLRAADRAVKNDA